MLNGINAEFPGIDGCPNTSVFRLMGPVGSREGIGCGFLHKSRVVDNLNIRWPRYVLVIVLRGSGCYVDESGIRHRLSAGDFFQRFPGRLHSNYVDEGSRYFECFLECGAALCQSLHAMRIIRNDIPAQSLMPNPSLPERIWRFHQSLKNGGDESLPDYVGEFIAILGQCLRRSAPEAPRTGESNIIELACQQLIADFGQEFELKKFCRQNGWGYEHFRKIFRQHVGISPWQYRVRRRLDTACSMLRDSNRPVAGIADSLGYSSAYEFSAQFKKYLGMSPRHLREANKS